MGTWLNACLNWRPGNQGFLVPRACAARTDSASPFRTGQARKRSSLGKHTWSTNPRRKPASACGMRIISFESPRWSELMAKSLGPNKPLRSHIRWREEARSGMSPARSSRKLARPARVSFKPKPRRTAGRVVWWRWVAQAMSVTRFSQMRTEFPHERNAQRHSIQRDTRLAA